MWSKFLNAFHRKPAAPSAAEIRGQLSDLRSRHERVTADRAALALDAVNSERIALQYLQLDDEASELENGMQLLRAALPAAEAREAEAARQAEAAARAKRLQTFDRQTIEAQAWLDDVVMRLPTAEELTKARDLRDSLNSEAIQMRTWSDAVGIRRPLDPLNVLVQAMQHRIDRVSRARWAHGAPITLGGASAEALTAAAARVEALERAR